MAFGCPKSRSLASICESPRQSVDQIRRRCHPAGGHLVLRSKNKKPALSFDWTACVARGPVRAKAGCRFSRICRALCKWMDKSALGNNVSDVPKLVKYSNSDSSHLLSKSVRHHLTCSWWAAGKYVLLWSFSQASLIPSYNICLSAWLTEFSFVATKISPLCVPGVACLWPGLLGFIKTALVIIFTV